MGVRVRGGGEGTGYGERRYPSPVHALIAPTNPGRAPGCVCSFSSIAIEASGSRRWHLHSTTRRRRSSMRHGARRMRRMGWACDAVVGCSEADEVDGLGV